MCVGHDEATDEFSYLFYPHVVFVILRSTDTGCG